MKKWILIGGGGIVVVIIVVLIIFVSNLGPIIKSAVNTYGPEITQTGVSLGDVGVSIFSGQASMTDFFLGNPKGFKSPHAVKVKSISVDVDEKSLTGNTIIIDRVEIINPDIIYEQAGSTDNFRTILNNVNRAASAKAASEKSDTPATRQEGKKIIIKDFVIKGGKVNLASAFLEGKGIMSTLPDIHLQNIGEKKGGVIPAEAFQQIFSVLYEKITSQSVTDALNEGLKSIGANFQLTGDGELKKIGENAQKELDNVSKGLGDAAGKIKGLFGK